MDCFHSGTIINDAAINICVQGVCVCVCVCVCTCDFSSIVYIPRSGHDNFMLNFLGSYQTFQTVCTFTFQPLKYECSVGGVTQTVECLLSKCEALSLSSTTKI
jgi:hypothetical protein